jgi:hypothetical protein
MKNLMIASSLAETKPVNATVQVYSIIATTSISCAGENIWIKDLVMGKWIQLHSNN